MDTVEAKAFVPAKDFELSKRFYEDLGFAVEWLSEDLACMPALPVSCLGNGHPQPECISIFSP